MIKLKIFDKYLIKQILKSTFVCILLFTVVWIAPETLFKIIQRTLNGTYTVSVGCQLLLFEIPKILGKALPVGLLLGALYSFDKYSKDSELTIFRSVGMSFNRIMAPVIAVSVIFTGLCFFINDKVNSYATNKIVALKDEGKSTHFVYTLKDEKDVPKKIVMVSKYDTKIGLKDIYVLNFSPKYYSDASMLSEILIGEYVKIDNDKWTLIKGKKYFLSEAGLFQKMENIDSEVILDGEKGKRAFTILNYSLKKHSEFNNAQMRYYMSLLKQEKMTDEYNIAFNKYLQRFFHSFVCIFFAVFGCILGFSKPREQKLIGFTIAIGVIFLYYITLPFFDLLAEKSVLSPWVTSSVQLVIMFFAIIWLKKFKGI